MKILGILEWNKNINFDVFKNFLILTEFGKLGSKIRQICLNWKLSLNFGKTELCDYLFVARNTRFCFK